MEYQKKIDFAIKLLQSTPQDGPIELCYSGGKDSDVILELAKMAGIPFDAIYKNTTIDPPGTIQHCRERGVRIVQPKKSFFKIVEESSMPTRFSRFCCKYLKEYKIHDRAILGIRRDESTKRAKRYTEPEQCRVFSKNEKVRQYYPILYWTTEDVARFIEQNNIQCAPIYYDDLGVFHAERRLGCLGCPLAADNGVSDYLEHPNLLKMVIKSMKRYLDAHQESKAYKYFEGDAHKAVYKRLFCKTMEEYRLNIDGGLFPELELDAKQYLESYFGIDLTI